MTGTICVVQARMGSTRLPGKVLADLGGRPLLHFLLRRLSPAAVDALVVATSDAARDDEVALAAERAGAEVVRGPEHDVLARYRVAIDRFRPDHVVRITADCPLVDPALVEAVLDQHRREGADYTSNVLPRTFPKGLDVEIASTDALMVADAEAQDSSEREHVMPFLYRRPERFRLANLRNPVDLGRERWTVDTPEDLARVREIVAALDGRADAGWQAVLAAAGVRWRPSAGVVLRLATEADEGYVLELRNEEVAVRESTTRRAVHPGEHRRWYRSRLASPSCRLWVATEDVRDVGSLRVDVRSGVGTVSVVVDARHRGRGMATRLLGQLDAELHGDQQVVELRALVRPTNLASQRAFERAGYRRTGEVGEMWEYRKPTGTVTT